MTMPKVTLNAPAWLVVLTLVLTAGFGQWALNRDWIAAVLAGLSTLLGCYGVNAQIQNERVDVATGKHAAVE